MDIILTKQSLLKGLQLLEPIVSGRGTLPITNEVLIQAKEKNKCILIGTDIETSLKTEIESKVNKIGEVCLPAKKFLEATKELPEDKDIVIKMKEDTPVVTLTCGKIKNVFVGQPAKNHPGMPPIDEKKIKSLQISISAEILENALTKTVFSVSKEESRYYLNGVYFNIQKEAAKFISTDGRRLSYVVKKIDNDKISVSGIVPTKSINRILDIINQLNPSVVKFTILPEHFVMETDETIFVSRLVSGEFPAYEQVIPKGLPTAVVNADNLTKVLKQVSWVIPEKGFGVKFHFSKNGLKLSASVESVGLSEAETEISYTGEDTEVKFEPEFIMDMLSVLDKGIELVIGLNNPTAPWTFQPKNDNSYLYILMPMKLQ